MQSYNRYAYVWNNPLKDTDATGYNASDDSASGAGYGSKNPDNPSDTAGVGGVSNGAGGQYGGNSGESYIVSVFNSTQPDPNAQGGVQVARATLTSPMPGIAIDTQSSWSFWKGLFSFGLRANPIAVGVAAGNFSEGLNPDEQKQLDEKRSAPLTVTSGGAMPPDDQNENQNKDYKKPNDKLEKGDQIDLDSFSKRVKVEGETRFKDPESEYQSSKDRAGDNCHGGSAWKLLDRAGERVGTLNSDGTFLRK